MTFLTNLFKRPKPGARARRRVLARASEARARQLASVPVTFLEDRHTQHCKVVPSRLHLLNRVPQGGTWAEVGAAFGDFTAEILARGKPDRLHLVDAWSGDRYGEGGDTISARFPNEIADGTLSLDRGLSVDVLPRFPLHYFDFVYIDTNHAYDTTRQELLLCADRVRPGGRIAGHDYCPGNVVKPVVYGVVQAVAEFCKTSDWGFEYLALAEDGHASFCLRRLSDF